MRILFTFVGGRGHFEPLAPIARAAAAAGHEVAFASGGLIDVVESAGFRAFAVAPLRSPPQRKPLAAVDEAREERLVRDVFMGSAARERAPATRALCERWRPDVVVCDEFDAGSAIAAELHGVPCAVVLENASGAWERLMAEATETLRAEHGLPSDGGPALVLSPFPPSLRPLPRAGVALRQDLAPAAAVDVPEGAVLFTLGTVFNLESGDLFTRVLAGLRDAGPDVLVTVGDELDPAELGRQPPHVHVRRYVPLAAALPRCAAVVSHGGSGTLVATLAHGLPSVLIPMGADQPGNAARCEALGVARVLEVMSATPGEVRDAVTAVLEQPSYRAAAERVRDEIAGLPGPDHAVALLITLRS